MQTSPKKNDSWTCKKANEIFQEAQRILMTKDSDEIEVLSYWRISKKCQDFEWQLRIFNSWKCNYIYMHIMQ